MLDAKRQNSGAFNISNFRLGDHNALQNNPLVSNLNEKIVLTISFYNASIYT
jgi:hypothetical protein